MWLVPGQKAGKLLQGLQTLIWQLIFLTTEMTILSPQRRVKYQKKELNPVLVSVP